MEKNRKSNKLEAKRIKSGIIASRKTCRVDGVGLSHYILVDKKTK